MSTRLQEHDYSVVVRGYGVHDYEGTALQMTEIKHKEELLEQITEKLDLGGRKIKDVALWMPGYNEWVGLSHELEELSERSGEALHLLQLYGSQGEEWAAPPPEAPAEAEAEAEWQEPTLEPQASQADSSGLGAFVPGGMGDVPMLKAIRKAIRTIPAMPAQAKESPEASEAIAIQLVPMMTPRQFPQYATIIDQGDDGDNEMYFIVSGTCQVAVDMAVVAVLGPQQAFGERCIGDPRSVRSSTVRAQTPVAVAVLTTANFAAALSSLSLGFVSESPQGFPMATGLGSAPSLATAARGVMMVSQTGRRPGRDAQPKPDPAPWSVQHTFDVEIEFSEPAKGQEAKLDKQCSGRCSFTGAAGSCMAADGTMLEGLAFSIEMDVSSTQTQTWRGVIRDPQPDGTGADVYLGNSGCVAVGEVASDPESRDIVFEMELKYTVTSPQRLAQLAKGNPDHLDKLTKQSHARAGTYMCKLAVSGQW